MIAIVQTSNSAISWTCPPAVLGRNDILVHHLWILLVLAPLERRDNRCSIRVLLLRWELTIQAQELQEQAESFVVLPPVRLCHRLLGHVLLREFKYDHWLLF